MDIRIDLLHIDVVGEIAVAVQKVLYDGIFLFGLHDPVNIHVLMQVIRDRLGVACHGIQLGGADVIFREVGRHLFRKDVGRDKNAQNDQCDNQGVNTALRRDLGRGFLVLAHELYLLFSSAWTERNRKKMMTDR